MRTARQVLAERAALSRLRVAARAYASSIRKAESAVALVGLEGDLPDADDHVDRQRLKETQREAKRAVNESKAASERLEAAALAWSERAPRRRTRRRK